MQGKPIGQVACALAFTPDFNSATPALAKISRWGSGIGRWPIAKTPGALGWEVAVALSPPIVTVAGMLAEPEALPKSRYSTSAPITERGRIPTIAFQPVAPPERPRDPRMGAPEAPTNCTSLRTCECQIGRASCRERV